VQRVVLVEPNPAKAAQLYVDMFGPEAVHDMKGGKTVVVGNSRVDIMTEAAFKEQVGKAGPDPMGRSAYMAALTFRTTSLARTARALQEGGIMGTSQFAGRLIVPASQAINTTLEFIE
jgi:hypothetical protein